MCDKVLEIILRSNVDDNYTQWLLLQFKNTYSSRCTIEEFARYFLTNVHCRIEEILKLHSTNKSVIQENEKTTNSKTVANSIQNAQDISFKKSTDLFGNTTNDDMLKSHHSFNKNMCSTPIQNNDRSYRNSLCSTNSFGTVSGNRTKTNRSLLIKSGNNSSLCLSDFVVSPISKSHNSSTTSTVNVTDNQSTKSRDDSVSAKDQNKSSGASNQNKKQRRRIRCRPTPVDPTTDDKCSFPRGDSICQLESGNTFESNGLSERDLLKKRKDLITKDFDTANILNRVKIDVPPKEENKNISEMVKQLEQNVSNKIGLSQLIRLYSSLFDLNLIVNILTEISFILNILNFICTMQLDADDQKVLNEIITPFDSILLRLPDCINLAAGVLSGQKHLLALFDTSTLKLLIDNESLLAFDRQLHEFLSTVYGHKISLETIAKKQQNLNQLNVLYQEESDTRDNFPSSVEFNAFRVQRDKFYTIYRTWEFNYVNRNFGIETNKKMLTSKVVELLTVMENPVNMAHLAKLFTSYLIISCNFEDDFPGLREAMPNINPDKLTKLNQRLVQPSPSSTDYQFPGKQSFFRDFYLAAEHNYVFVEQLKLSIINTLIEIDSASFETINANFNGESLTECDEVIVQPETLNVLLVLAKFAGLIISRPFQCKLTRNQVVDDKQIALRNLIQPSFDIKTMLMKSINSHKILVTLPWIIQYLSMFDMITLRLNYYKDIFMLLYKIFNLPLAANNKYLICDKRILLRPTSMFLLKLCISWLIEKADLFDDFYKSWPMSTTQLYTMNKFNGNINLTSFPNILNPTLERIVMIACPFLADFRVSIIQTNTKKSVSRTGNYRYINTKVSDPIESAKNNRSLLINAFINSQSPSVRRTIEFVTERTISAVIKDFQIDFMVQNRKDATKQTKLIKSTFSLKDIEKEIYRIYTEYQTILVKQWNDNISGTIEKRLTGAFNALFPQEMSDAVRNLCIQISKDRCLTKCNEWRSVNFMSLDFYSTDINREAKSIAKGVQDVDVNTELTYPIIFDTFALIQKLLYVFNTKQYDTIYPSGYDFKELFNGIKEILNLEQLTASTYEILAVNLLQLLYLLIYYKPQLVNNEMLNEFFTVWEHDYMKAFVKRLSADQQVKSVYIFKRVVSPLVMFNLHEKPIESYDSFGMFLENLLDRKILTLNELNEQWVTIYQHDWPKVLHDKLANILEKLTDKYQPKDIEQQEDKLFMEMLTDLAREIDEF